MPETVLGKVMAVLEAFEAEDHGVRFAELQRRTGLPKATLHRLVGDMVDAGLLDRMHGTYYLGRHLFELGLRASAERSLLEVATPFLEDLYEQTHEIVHLAVREGRDVVYVAKVSGHRAARTPSRVGGRMPVHATALGKAMLAHATEEEVRSMLRGPLQRRTPHTITAAGRLRTQLDEIAETGVAYEFEEGAIGLVCIGAPILDSERKPLGAISISGDSIRFRPPDHAASILEAARGIAVGLTRRAARFAQL